jgi:hypothetical protein
MNHTAFISDSYLKLCAGWRLVVPVVHFNEFARLHKCDWHDLEIHSALQ